MSARKNGYTLDRQGLSDAVAEWQNDAGLCQVINAFYTHFEHYSPKARQQS